MEGGLIHPTGEGWWWWGGGGRRRKKKEVEGGERERKKEGYYCTACRDQFLNYHSTFKRKLQSFAKRRA